MTKQEAFDLAKTVNAIIVRFGYCCMPHYFGPKLKWMVVISHLTH